MSKKNTLPEYWYTEKHQEVVDYLNNNYGSNFVGSQSYYGYSKRGIKGVDAACRNRAANFDNGEEYITLEQFRACIKGEKIKAPVKPKNLKLLKDMPTVTINGVQYKRPKGTVYGWDEGRKLWQVVKGRSEELVSLKDLEDNKDWYKETTAKPTYQIFYVDGKEVKFLEGKIEVGCTTISNDTVREIAKRLKK